MFLKAHVKARLVCTIYFAGNVGTDTTRDDNDSQ